MNIVILKGPPSDRTHYTVIQCATEENWKQLAKEGVLRGEKVFLDNFDLEQAGDFTRICLEKNYVFMIVPSQSSAAFVQVYLKPDAREKNRFSELSTKGGKR